MNNNITSTVVFRSNLQPVIGSYETDRRFLSAIHNPFALEVMKKRGFNTVTPIQSREYKSASLHCAYAFPDDYPFGTVIDENGKERVVCKCTNTKCSYFSSCRPDFDPAELIVSENNVYFVERIREILTTSAKKFEKNSQNGDSLAAAAALSGAIKEKKALLSLIL